MKTISKMWSRKTYSIIAIGVISLFTNQSIAQNADKILKQTFTGFDTVKTYSQKVPYVLQFKLIAAKSPDNWLNNYYAAYSIAELSFTETDKKKVEPMLIEADTYFEKIKSMTSSNEEVNILGALLASAKIAANPSDFKKYFDIRDKYLEAVKALNPDNPRLYYLEGNATYYTPQIYGGGAKKAFPSYEKASVLFAKEKKSDITKPYWGANHNIYMMNRCKKEMK